MKPVRFFKTALSRQLAEALRIQERGEGVVLNSKAEYNRSKIGRLTLGEEDQRTQNQGDKDQEGGEDQARATQESISTWERMRNLDRRVQEVKDSNVMQCSHLVRFFQTLPRSGIF